MNKLLLVKLLPERIDPHMESVFAVGVEHERNYTTLDGLKDHLSSHFRLVGEPRKVPFVIRETGHMHQHTLSEVTIWERLPRV